MALGLAQELLLVGEFDIGDDVIQANWVEVEQCALNSGMGRRG
jgi:hypothetical protein